MYFTSFAGILLQSLKVKNLAEFFLKIFLIFFKKGIDKFEISCIIVSLLEATQQKNARVAELADAHV